MINKNANYVAILRQKCNIVIEALQKHSLIRKVLVALLCSLLTILCFSQGYEVALKDMIRSQELWYNGHIYIIIDTGYVYDQE